jgi:hypothetical protein
VIERRHQRVSPVAVHSTSVRSVDDIGRPGAGKGDERPEWGKTGLLEQLQRMAVQA